MQQETRYTLFKLKDVQKALTPSEVLVLDALSAKVEAFRASEGKAPLEAVVVEHDWPEYRATWKAIKKRVSEGKPPPMTVAI